MMKKMYLLSKILNAIYILKENIRQSFFFPFDFLYNIFRNIHLTCFVLTYIRVGIIVFHTLYFLAEFWYNFQDDS